MKKGFCILLAFMMFCLAGCGNGESGSNAENGEVTLAFSGSQTGDFAEYGQSMKAAAQIAIDEWNEKGGVLGYFSSGVAMTAAEIYQEEGIALVNGSATHVDYSKIGDFIFRNNAIYVTEASTCIQVTEYLGRKKLGILNPNSDAGV